MFDRLEDLVRRYEEVMNLLAEPDVANDNARFRALMKEQSDLQPVVEAFGMKMGTVLQAPMEGLIKYHTQN